MKLNLGCGQNRMDGYVNVDKFAACGPDLAWDLECLPWPFEDSSADEVVMRRVLEHLGGTVDGFSAIMQELYRVCTPGATVKLAVPHPRSESYAGDPTHVRPITPAIMLLFSKKKNLEWKQLGWPNTPLGLYLDIDFDMIGYDYSLVPYWMEKLRTGQMTAAEVNFDANHYFNVVDELQITLRACKQAVSAPPEHRATADVA